ncbi:MAG: hypothetical protein U1C50_04010 [Patescibacteria group bacterium]|nr:hypothetical protein [Patescibacteria group bacterium]
MLDLSQNPLFWPNQADFVVDKTNQNIFIGTGIATKTQLSQAIPIDIIGFLLSAEFVKRQIPQAKVFLLIADQHAWLANDFNREECQKTADNLLKIIQKIIKIFKMESWQISLASQIFPDTLPQSYEELEKRDVTHFFNHHHCGFKIGWSFSASETSHKTDEAHFDQQLNLPILSIFTKPGVTSNPKKPFESPYICTGPDTRVTIDLPSTPGWNVNPAVKNNLNRITMLFEQLIKSFPNKTPLENKVETIIKIICN